MDPYALSTSLGGPYVLCILYGDSFSRMMHDDPPHHTWDPRATLKLMWIRIVLWLILDMLWAMMITSLVVVVDFDIISRENLLGLSMMLLTTT